MQTYPQRERRNTAGYMLRLFVLLSFLLACMHASLLEASPQLRLMPLGDSITEARGGNASYRYWLWQLLQQGGYEVEFVGSRTGVYRGAPKYSDFDQDHEGHWGWTTDEVVARLRPWAAAAQPDVVLCHVGTNDLLRGEGVGSTLGELGQLVDTLRGHNPDVIILLAQLIPAQSGQDRIAAFNHALPALAAEKTLRASPIIVVDHWSGFDPRQDTYDGLHPNEAGEQKMAQKWYEALQKVLPKKNARR